MTDIISVIMPVYNVEKYVGQSIESVCKQTYRNLQIIVIDDGSTDNSGKICDEYAKKDKRITVVHQKNRGAAAAKNEGLKRVMGKYVSFVDSDDYLETDAYEFMMEQLNKHQADIVQCSFRKIFQNKVEERNFLEQKQYDACSYLELFTKNWTCGLLWDKLYKSTLLKGLYFKEGHKIDDEFFTYKVVMNAKKIVSVPRNIYNYRQRLSSVMYSESSQEKIIEDTIEYLSIRRKDVIDKFPQLQQVYDEHFLNMMCILSRKNMLTESGIIKIKSALKLYGQEKKKIRISFSLWIKLLQIRALSNKKILDKRTRLEEKIDVESYFR